MKYGNFAIRGLFELLLNNNSKDNKQRVEYIMRFKLIQDLLKTLESRLWRLAVDDEIFI